MSTSAIAKTLLSPGLVTAVLLIFGGCCSNVYTLEAITHRVSDCALLVTFSQFLGVTVLGFIQLSATHPGRQAIWQHKVPLIEYCKIVGFHFSVSVLNNLALNYHISVPVHIILRSGGSMVTMLLAYLFFGRRYTHRQIAAVLLVTLGVIISTTSGRDSTAVSENPEQDSADYSRFLLGVSFMVFSQFLASSMGLYLERTFRLYSPSWKETLFFTHLLALPFFLPFLPTISRQFSVLAASPPFYDVGAFPDAKPGYFNPPTLLVDLFLNIFTQLICVAGVNQLASASTALSVSIVLNLRKFTSLVLSFIMFGHKLHFGLAVGAILVFVGALWYSQEAPHVSHKLEVRNSEINLKAMAGTGERKSQGTPLLEKGDWDEAPSAEPLQMAQHPYGNRRKSSVSTHNT